MSRCSSRPTRTRLPGEPPSSLVPLYQCSGGARSVSVPGGARDATGGQRQRRRRASRAEAASAIAEAEIAVQALRAATGTQPGGGADVAQAGTLLQQASGEFAKQNYGGALYLANQTKSLTSASRSRLGGAGRPPLRPGEVSFAVPVRLRATVRSKVRGGPGAAYKVL